MLKCVKIFSFFFILLFELLPDTTSTVSGDCDFLRLCVNYKYRKKKNLLTQLLTKNNSKKFKDDINEIVKELYDSKQITKQVYNILNKSILTKK